MHFACREANNVNNDLPLLVRGYIYSKVVEVLLYIQNDTHMYCETHVYTSENSTTAYIIILLLEIVTIPIQTCIPTADLDYGEDIMFYKWQKFHKNN